LIHLRITYQLRAHHMTAFETVFREQIIPITEERGLTLDGFWRTSVGDVGEYMELWRFESMADFDQRWNALIADARIQKIFETTGPMVEHEKWSLLQPALQEPE